MADDTDTSAGGQCAWCRDPLPATATHSIVRRRLPDGTEVALHAGCVRKWRRAVREPGPARLAGASARWPHHG
jgi:hypothetical protein